MADNQTTITPDKVEQDEFNYEKDHGKSFREIMLDQLKEAPVQEPAAESKDLPEVQEPTVETEQPKEPPVDIEKIKAEAAAAARAEARAEIEAEHKKQQETIEAKNVSEAEKEKQLKDLEYSWKKEGRQPKDYDEIADEAERRALAKFEARQAEREAKAEQERVAKMTAEQQQAEQVRRAQEAQDKQFQAELDADLNDLYATDKLPKIQDPTNPNDPGILARDALFQAGIQVNNQRIKDGKLPIRSLKLVFYEHYKLPTAQPPGADAPVMGNTPPPSKQTNDEYVWARDHNKTPRQLLLEERQRVQKRQAKAN